MGLQDDERRRMSIRRSRGRSILLSEEIIAVLREVLEDTIDFDKTFKDKYWQDSLFHSESETLTFGAWNERLRSLPREERLKVQQVLREYEYLFDRILTAMKGSVSSKVDSAFVPLRPPRLISEATSYLENFFATSLKYLGPLRDAPKPLYPLAPAADPYDVGLRGEHTASILELHKNKKIRYIPSANFKDPVIDYKAVTRTLETAVIDWLNYLGVASSVISRDQGKLGHELKVRLPNSESTHDLTHVGVGVSQVLPILVMCLLADTDSTLVFEQPELHLHPKVQTLLGDFFLSMALCKKQCIVETHSEYFIDRLRFRIAASSSEKELNNQTKIYFVEKLSRGSFFREVVINEYGAISDWPEGFFDQSQQLAEEILKAALAKRRAIKNKD
jgi:predicted ATPase